MKEEGGQLWPFCVRISLNIHEIAPVRETEKQIHRYEKCNPLWQVLVACLNNDFMHPTDTRCSNSMTEYYLHFSKWHCENILKNSS